MTTSELPVDELDRMTEADLLREQVRLLRALDAKIQGLSDLEELSMRESSTSPEEKVKAAVIKDFDMPLGNMFIFMFKLLIAAIPEIIIFVLFIFLLFS